MAGEVCEWCALVLGATTTAGWR
ncbi:hypothetical protein [Kribbella sp. CA-294648]